ncbi:hypothetical protein [Nocardia sp. NPDC050710]|uniref:hypothetical protein n=1 Tax=Nocardia sp. NPDC050710 TaxID=3157220 RepID=UPI00340EAE28
MNHHDNHFHGPGSYGAGPAGRRWEMYGLPVTGSAADIRAAEQILADIERREWRRPVHEGHPAPNLAGTGFVLTQLEREVTDPASEYLLLRTVLDAVKAIARARRGCGELARSLLIGDRVLAPLNAVCAELRARTQPLPPDDGAEAR